MKTLTGADVGYLRLGELSKIADLIYFDGPLLSLSHSNEGENVLHLWCDSDAECNRWIVFTVSDGSLESYLNGNVPLRDVVQNPKGGFVYCVDYSDSLEQRNAVIVAPKQLPENYLPHEDSYYSEVPIYSDSTTTLKVGIAGEWGFYDLNYFPKVFREAYAFISRFVAGVLPTQGLPTFPMRDGFSTLHFFQQLLSSLPSNISPSLRGVRYASPGAIVFNVDRRVTKALLPVIESVRANNSTAGGTYDFLYGILVSQKLLGANALTAVIDPIVERHISKQTVELAHALLLPNPQWIISTTPNPLMAAKIMLAFFRLIHDRLLTYERDKRISFSTVY